MKKWLLTVAIIFFCSMSFLSGKKVFEIHKSDSATHFSRLIFLPDSLVKLTSLGFPSLVADYLMLNLLVVHGEKLINEISLTPEEWEKTYQGVLRITKLDPSFRDPYIFAQMSLPWDAGMVDETNQLLLKAAEYRPDDYQPYFFLWFNHDYFLKNPRKAGKYLQKAARKPGAPRWYASLAARYNLYGGDILSGIIFLKEMIANSNDSGAKYHWKIRLDCLEKIALLEGKVKQFKDKYGEMPKKLEEISSKGLLPEIPKDPYGGSFFINEFGRVYTTSKMAYATVKQDK